MAISRLTRIIVVLALGLAGFIVLRDQMQRHPERMPWTPLSLMQPVGPFTGTKLTSLTRDAPHCRELLRLAGVEFTAVPPVTGAQCGYADGVKMPEVGAARWQPALQSVACPVAAAMVMWEREVVQPAAERHFRSKVVQFEHFGSFNCRRIAGRESWSEHATADAIDIAGFRLADGTRVRVLGDWNGDAAKAAFLREVRDGACDLFATTLSPDYNVAHADHFHLDQAVRGGGVCR